MAIMDRILLALYVLLVGAGLVVAAGLPVGVYSIEQAVNEIQFAAQRWETWLAAALMLIASLRLLKADLWRSNDEYRDEAVVFYGEIGQVRITVSALKELIERVVLAISGVREVHPEVRVKREQGDALLLKVRLKMTVGMDTNVPDVSAKVQEAVKKCLLDTVGIAADDIEILVERISNVREQKRRSIQ